jgi:hypothetical protein
MRILNLSALGAAGLLGVSAAGQPLIDAFSDPAGGSSLWATPGPGILGGWRRGNITAAGPGSLAAAVAFNDLPGLFSIENPVGASSVTEITYDGNGAGLGDIDLIGAGYGAIRFELESVANAASVTVRLYDGATVSFLTRALPEASSSMDFLLPFEDFGTGGPDDPFTSLDRIVLTFNASEEAVVVINQIDFVRTAASVVPEASSVVGMVGLVLVAGATVGLQRRRSQIGSTC